MESFSLLKYWKTRGGGGRDCCTGGVGGGSGGGSRGDTPLAGGGNVTMTTIVAAVGDHAGDNDFDSGCGGSGGGDTLLSGEGDVTMTTTIATVVGDLDGDSNCGGGGGGGGDDEGPFFDLEFSVPAEGEDNDEDDENEESLKFDNENENGDEGEEEEEKDDNLNANLSLSPSDDLFFKSRIVRMDGSDEETTSKSGQFPIPVSLLRSATRFRIFMLNLKRSKSESTTTTTTPTTTAKPQNPPPKNINKKLFTVKMKFKAEELPILSLLTRASSNSKLSTTTAASAASATVAEEEKRVKKEVIQKYLKLVKPLYVRVSKKKPAAAAADTAAATADTAAATAVTAADTAEATAEEVAAEVVEGKGQKQGMKLKEIAKKHLGKSKTAVVHSMPNGNNVASERRDDSLLQLQDGIQSAILHCKRSFNSSTDGEEQPVHDACEEKKTTTTEVAELTEEGGNGNV